MFEVPACWCWVAPGVPLLWPPEARRLAGGPALAAMQARLLKADLNVGFSIPSPGHLLSLCCHTSSVRSRVILLVLCLMFSFVIFHTNTAVPAQSSPSSLCIPVAVSLRGSALGVSGMTTKLISSGLTDGAEHFKIRF